MQARYHCYSPPTEIDVQHGGVCALDEHGLALGDPVVDEGDRLHHHRTDPLGELPVSRHLGPLVHLEGGVAGHVTVGQNSEPARWERSF